MKGISMTRRRFLSVGGTGLVFPTLSRAAIPEKDSTRTTPLEIDVAAIDRARVLKAADRYLNSQPITITAYPCARSAGGIHDYYSDADYWWPDPKDPKGPYIHRDGMSNPQNFTVHRHALMRLSIQVGALGAAWHITHDERYAIQAAKHLRAWFLDKTTLMNPSLQYSQAIHGLATGRSIGIIDTLHLVEVARSVSAISDSHALSAGDSEAVRRWFEKYLEWMTTSPHGIQERDAKNNHGTCWVMQVSEFARYVGRSDLMDFCRSRFKTVLVPTQIASDGSLPLELRRTKPYGYCLFDLEALTTVCQILSTPQESLFQFELADGRSLAKAMNFMFPFIANKGLWPYPHDVMYFDQWPVRQVSLLFAGLALRRRNYLALWRRLNPDPTVEEVLRNYPIRQPVLWVKPIA